MEFPLSILFLSFASFSFNIFSFLLSDQVTLGASCCKDYPVNTSCYKDSHTFGKLYNRKLICLKEHSNLVVVS